jgi:alkanesulfonate monooxygenase SsuD/methylene tetrahydromethanopterin reductase-like flavin-dependent oxidoreductase (luciferase family)
MDAMFKGGANCAMIDPVTIVSAMAAVTKSVCFGITGSTSYIGKASVLARKHFPVTLKTD